MKIACETCGAKYTIADDKVRGRKVKIRCKGCGTPIVVDGQHGGGPSISDAETEAALEPDAPTVWSVNLSDTDSRTMSLEEIVAGYASGLVTSDAFVWKDGMGDWVAILDSELAPHLSGAAPSPKAAPSAPAASAPSTPAAALSPLAPVAAAPSASAPSAAARGTIPQFAAPNSGPAPTVSTSRAAAARPAAARLQAQPDNTQDLFGAIDTAGSDDDEVATSAPVVPQAGSSAYDDGKMTGARNENSVLFSLDALKAGFSPSAPAANAKPTPKAPKGPANRPQQPSNPDDPFGMGASAGLGGMGGGALFGADNAALLTAPAPLPPPPPSPAQVASGAVPAYAPPPQKNKLVLILGGVGGVAIIGLLAALVFGRKHEAEPSTEGSALSSASAAPEKAPEATKAEEPAAKPEEKPAESAGAAPSASAAPEAKPADKPVAVAMKTDAPKKPREEAPPPADAPPFSKASAISALSAAASSAGSCKKPGGPTGGGKATVTFAPSGRVTTATVAGGSFAGTPVGGCIASVFRRAHVPAFSGSSVTVSKSFSVN